VSSSSDEPPPRRSDHGAAAAQEPAGSGDGTAGRAEPSTESIPPRGRETDPATATDARPGTGLEALPEAPTTRLAPSPTGLLHLGHARSFLAAWWFARARGGRVVMRVEDLDGARCRPEWADAALRDLEWLGLDWDGAPLVQSDDLEPYHAAVERLLAAGDAYPCVCTRRQIEGALDAPHAAGTELRYPGTCRGRFASRAAAEASSGRVAGVRFAVSPGVRAVDDLLLGRIEAEPDAECGDFLVLRRDGAIAYQLAVVVDDARQGVDLVVRGDDLVPSTLRQALLQDALDLPHPAWLHTSLVLDATGARLSKRGGARSLAELREAGVDPRRIVGWAAASLGFHAEGGFDAVEGCDGDDSSDPGASSDPIGVELADPAGWLPRVRLADAARRPARVDARAGSGSSSARGAAEDSGRNDDAPSA